MALDRGSLTGDLVDIVIHTGGAIDFALYQKN